MLGEMLSSVVTKFNYSSVLKEQFKFQENNKDSFLLSSISKEIPIQRLNYKTEETEIFEEENKLEKIEDLGELETDENEIAPEIADDTQDNIEVESNLVSLPTEVIQANNLPETYNTIYESVKIKNETDFNLSQEILTPDVEFSDKKDIVIFHTHTCESYTQTETNSYTPSRKFQNNRFKLFCCKSWNRARGESNQ